MMPRQTVRSFFHEIQRSQTIAQPERITFPAAMWMASAGRRIGFICGSLLGLAGGGIAALGIAQQSMALLATGTFLVGAY